MDGTRDQTYIANFQSKLMIGDSILLKPIEQCTTQHFFQVTIDVIHFREAIF